MSIKQKLSLVLALSLSVLSFESMAQEAQETGAALRVGVGLSLRQFKEVTLKGGGTRNETLYENKHLGAMSESKYASTVTLNKDGEVCTSDGFAPVIFGSLRLFEQDKLAVSLAGNFQYFSVDANGASVSRTTVNTYLTALQHPELGSVLADSKTSISTAKISTEMDLYVLDLGIRADYGLTEKVTAYAAMGPSLSLASMEVRGNGLSRSADRLVPGLYGQVGLEYSLMEHVSVAADVRYDVCFDDVELGIAKQELDGFGASIKLIYSF